MDGENKGKPYEQMDDLGGKNPYFWFNTHFQLPQKNMVKSTSYPFLSKRRNLILPMKNHSGNPGGEESIKNWGRDRIPTDPGT